MAFVHWFICLGNQLVEQMDIWSFSTDGLYSQVGPYSQTCIHLLIPSIKKTGPKY